MATASRSRPEAAVATRISMRPRLVTWLVIFGATFLVHVTSPNTMVADSLRTVPVASSIVHRGTISLDFYAGPVPSGEARWGGPAPVPGYGVEEVNGHFYPRFPWSVSLFIVPVVVLFDGAHALGLGGGVEARALAKNTDWEFQLLAMSYVVALATVVVYEIAHSLLGGLQARRRKGTALLVAFVFSLCTSVWSTASRAAWQHGPAILFLSIAALLAVRSRDSPRAVRWMGAPLAAAYAVRPTSIIPLALFSLWVAVRHRAHLVSYSLGALLVLVPFFAVNHSAWGSLLPPYYSAGRLGENPAFAEALVGNLLSPARGLFVFSPVLLLAVVGVGYKLRRRRFDDLDLLLVSCIVLHWVAISLAVDNSPIPHWWGGHSFGSRLFSDMVPFLVVLAIPVVARLAAAPAATGRVRLAQTTCLVLSAGSFFVHWQGAYLRSSYCWNDLPVEIDENPQRLWDWQDPQLLRGIRQLRSGPDPRSELVRGGVSAVGCPAPEES